MYLCLCVDVRPFIIIIVLGAQYTDLVEVVQVVPHNTQWGPFITILLWSTSGCASEAPAY